MEWDTRAWINRQIQSQARKIPPPGHIVPFASHPPPGFNIRRGFFAGRRGELWKRDFDTHIFPDKTRADVRYPGSRRLHYAAGN